MQNNYAPQGAFTVGDVVVWASTLSNVARNGDLVTIVKVTPYGDIMDLYHVEFENGDVVPALSDDFVLDTLDAKAFVTA